MINLGIAILVHCLRKKVLKSEEKILTDNLIVVNKSVNNQLPSVLTCQTKTGSSSLLKFKAFLTDKVFKPSYSTDSSGRKLFYCWCY